ncbi:MAG: hypothetical protein OQK82_03175 [Candidatus Pacearchaeota archaeon]|nr:hypothetical protein [Candidatus Pacearchaeota archaeon]
MNIKTSVFFKELLVQYPEPPRPVSFSAIFNLVLRQASMVVVMIFGLLMLIVAGIVANEPDTIYVIEIIMVTVGLFAIAAPAIYSRKLQSAIRNGQVKTATVTSSSFAKPGASNTLDSIKNGFVTGTWSIPEVGTLKFEIDEPWAAEVMTGSKVTVLVTGNTISNVFPLEIPYEKQ